MKIIEVKRCGLSTCPYCRDYTNGIACVNEFPRKEIRSKHFDEFDGFLFPYWCKLNNEGEENEDD